MTAPAIPLALIAQSDDMPWAHGMLSPDLSIKLLMADVEGGFMAVCVRFQPGTTLPTHLHTGAVHAYTYQGSWHYLEYGEESMNVPGSYIYEPAGSTHTLHSSDTEVTEAFFIIHGAFLNYDADGNFVGHFDPAVTIALYTEILEAQGDTVPEYILGGNCTYRR